MYKYVVSFYYWVVLWYWDITICLLINELMMTISLCISITNLWEFQLLHFLAKTGLLSSILIFSKSNNYVVLSHYNSINLHFLGDWAHFHTAVGIHQTSYVNCLFKIAHFGGGNVFIFAIEIFNCFSIIY